MNSEKLAQFGDACASCGYVYAAGERLHEHQVKAPARFSGAAVGLLMLIVGSTGCASVAKPRTQRTPLAEIMTVSVVSWLQPRYSFSNGGKIWRRVEERFESAAEADQFEASFSVREKRLLDVKQTDFAIQEHRR